MPKQAPRQIKELINQSGKVLIVTKKQFSGDGLASALALLLIMTKFNKNAEIIVDGFKLPGNLSFLPRAAEVKAAAGKLKKFIINLDISQTGLEDLSYDVEGHNLRIHLSPKQGVFTPDDLSLQASEFAYDLILAIDAPQLENLGKIYDHHRDLFYKIPVINLDHNPANDQYGHLNLVDITASSVAEIIYGLLKDWDGEIMDKDIATCLLTGIISKTKSFKTSGVSPEVLNIASELIKLGANRKEIVAQLFQTKTIATLKLWGKILSRLQASPDHRLVWSRLDLHDFTESGASEKDITGVVSELITNNPLAEIIVLFYQTAPEQTKVLLHTESTLNALALVRQFSPEGDNDDASFVINDNLERAEQLVLTAVSS